MADSPLTQPQRSIIVFERQPFWEPELRRQFVADEVHVRGCRTITDLEQLTSTGSERIGSGTIAVANLDDAAADLIRWLLRRLTGGRSVPTIVIASDATRELEWHAREAGALAVISHDIGGHELARLCQKQWSTATAAAFISSENGL